MFNIKDESCQKKTRQRSVDLFLDSGAYSAMTQGVNINLQDYIDFVKKHLDYISVYANLDVIGDAEASEKNLREMMRQGLTPLPVYHVSDCRPDMLRAMVREFEYIAIGGMVATGAYSTSGKILDELFSTILCDDHGMPKCKVHGFGVTKLSWLIRYPWYSVDSTSWVVTGRTGAVYVPRFRSGSWVYMENPWKVAVSTRSPSKKEAGQHIDTFSASERQVINQYFECKGYRLGSSEFRLESKNYTLQEGERWNGEALVDGHREVEKIIEPGLCNDYMLRDELNIIYFLDLEKSLPEWPWSFKLSESAKGFGL